MAAQLLLSVNPSTASFTTRQRTVLGASYHVSADGVDGAFSLVLVDCAGNAVAITDEDGKIALNTQAAIDVFPRGCSVGVVSTFHGYIVQNGTTIAGGSIPVLYSPITFSEVGEPVTLRGEQGVPGAPGKSAFAEWLEYNPGGTWEGFLYAIRGQKGDDGRDAAVIETNGLFSFRVDGENLFVYAQGEDALYARDAEGMIDYTKPLYHVNSVGDLLYDFYYYSPDVDDPVIKTMNLGRVRGDSAYETWLSKYPGGNEDAFLAAIKGEKGEPGKDGVSLEDVQNFLTQGGITAEQVGAVPLASAEMVYTETDVSFRNLLFSGGRVWDYIYFGDFLYFNNEVLHPFSPTGNTASQIVLYQNVEGGELGTLIPIKDSETGETIYIRARNGALETVKAIT